MLVRLPGGLPEGATLLSGVVFFPRLVVGQIDADLVQRKLGLVLTTTCRLVSSILSAELEQHIYHYGIFH